MKPLRKYLFAFILATLSLVLVVGCAGSAFTPQGGPKDIIPPGVMETSIPNETTSFSDDKIIFTFSEYIQLNNPSNTFFVSPPQKDAFSLRLKGKNLIVDCQDLLPNTTYQLQFNNTVKDFTEGNEAEPFSFVFSTGPIIDSLQYAIHIDPKGPYPFEEPVQAFLYHAEDTPFISEPLYRSIYNKNTLSFNYLPNQQYRLAVIKDLNQNEKPDQLGEFIFISDELITPNQPSATGLDSINLFAYQPSKPQLRAVRLLTSVCVISNTYQSALYVPSSPTNLQHLNRSGDSLWIGGIPETKDSLLVQTYASLDTVPIESLPQTTGLLGDTAWFSNESFTIQAKTLFHKNQIQTDTIRLIDSLGKKMPFTASLDTSKLPYTLNLSPTEDTLRFPFQLVVPRGTFKTSDSTSFVKKKYNITYKATVSTSSITLEEIPKRPNLRVLILGPESQFVQDLLLSENTLTLSLKPQVYNLIFYIDENQNKKWDGVSWPSYSAAEPILLQKNNFTVRDDWQHILNLNKL